MKKIILSKSSQKFLHKLTRSDKKMCAAIMRKIDELAVNQIPASCKKLVSHDNFYRIRIDKYRVIYSFDDDFVYVNHIAKREDVYDFLLRS